MTSPRISVVIPIYNAAPFVRHGVSSILAQTFKDFEVIAVDDGSTDESKSILEDLASRDERVRIISRPNTGIVGALNDGLAAARGEFIARMDADDWALPHRFETQVAYLSVHPECVVLGSDILYTDPEGRCLVRHEPVLTHEAILAQLLNANGGALIHPATMFRRDAVERVGRYQERFKYVEDLDLYLRLSEVGQLVNLDEVLLHYRQHLKSINHIQGTREALRLEAVNPHRRRHNMPDLSPSPSVPEHPQTPADWRRHWAFEAARGKHFSTARANSLRALAAAPGDKRNWRCVKYVWYSVRGAVSAQRA